LFYIFNFQYFDINNSPSEEQIKEMAQRTNLAEKVGEILF